MRTAASRPNIQEQKAFYDAHYEKKSREKRAGLDADLWARQQEILRVIRKIKLPPKARILELGCGLGHVAHELSRFGEVTAIDLSASAIERAKKLYPQVNFISDNLFQVEFKQNYYHLLVSSEVIEHILPQEKNTYLSIVDNSLADTSSLPLQTRRLQIS